MRREVIILTYHGVSDSWPDALTVTPGRFDEQIRFMQGAGYRGATLTEALTAPPAGRTFVVTFDDAYAQTMRLAEPILTGHGVPATVFVPTGFAGTSRPMAWPGNELWRGTPHEDELLCSSWDELRRLSRAGWEIGSHTVTHPHLTTLDDATLDAELADSRATCEREIGAPCLSLAYPYSDEDDRVVTAVRRAGYALAVTVPPAGWEHPLPLRWPRIHVGPLDSPLRLRARLVGHRSHLAFVATSTAVRGARSARAALSATRLRTTIRRRTR